jgi:murein DD-endopeptidase MepM/ murein hydrolase activator NlpD
MRLAPSTDTIRSHRRRSRLRVLVLLIAVPALAAVALGAFRPGPAPKITVRAPLGAIGRATPVEVDVTVASRGFSRVEVEVVQGERVLPVAAESFSTPPGWKLWEQGTTAKTWKLVIGKDSLPALAEGEAEVRAVATGAPAWIRAAPTTVTTVALPVRLVPPALEVMSTQHYVAQGGAEVVVYRAGPTSVRDGVEAGDWFFPGFPLPGGGERDRFALFAVPWDVDDPAKVRLVAADEVGNARSAAFVDQFFPKPPASDDIELDEKFLARVVPPILENTPSLTSKGNLLEDYLQINRDLRRANADELRALAGSSRKEFLWNAPFLALPGGQVMSAFADRRTYHYQGREVDRQVHLGFDLASIARADVPAANAGVVVLARWLGIYGNTVVVDHGFGLMSLYAHLSSIAVAEGDTVGRGTLLGNSGTTGLAGGDHLHFSFLLQGLPVRPVEWWDAHWIEDRLKRKLGAALPWAG